MILAAPILAPFMTLKGQLCVLWLRMMLTADPRFFYHLFLKSGRVYWSRPSALGLAVYRQALEAWGSRFIIIID